MTTEFFVCILFRLQLIFSIIGISLLRHRRRRHHQIQTNQLDFLLSKASEYSNFISKDLEDLQMAMAEQARKKVERAEARSKKGKKRGGEQQPPSRNKKSKVNGNDAAGQLQTAFVKDAKVRAGTKPIFIQPPNLAEGCFLKDYQLEGVRWLASLFENGVSGILADEVRSKQTKKGKFCVSTSYATTSTSDN